MTKKISRSDDRKKQLRWKEYKFVNETKRKIGDHSHKKKRVQNQSNKLK